MKKLPEHKSHPKVLYVCEINNAIPDFRVFGIYKPMYTYNWPSQHFWKMNAIVYFITWGSLNNKA